MFTGCLSRGIVGLAVAVMAPVAFACENPDNITIRLRDAPPERIEPGEFVLELDAGSKQVIEREPTVIDEPGFKIALDNRFASYNVVRVLAGQYSESTARVSMFETSCNFLGGGTSGLSYLVGRSAVEKDGFAFVQPRPITGAELHALWDRAEEAKH